MKTSNELVWEAVDAIKAARTSLELARTNLVLAGLGDDSVRFQKQLSKLDAQLTNLKKRVSRTVGVRV